MNLKELSTTYDDTFVPDEQYLASMPDIQNKTFASSHAIDHVGIHNMRVPLRMRMRNGRIQGVQARITGTVSLEAQKRGINMSRILRTFYKSSGDVFDIDVLGEVLVNYKKDLQSFDAHIQVNFDYYLWRNALRSRREDGTPEGGYQYYNITFDCNLDWKGTLTKTMVVDYVYSSACPCSTELSTHAALTRNVYGIPHSQRSCARLYITTDDFIWIEDVLDACRTALPTETLVFCKRVDEQAFAELNASQTKFVEDAVRYLADALDSKPTVQDYKIICSHAESLHSHNAIAVITAHNSRFSPDVTIDEWNALVK